ncbi:GIY-YIG nuclease family protein [Neobacillus bataviensis]|uniref:GIY-YIG nuclease family protein n=1 Tax=Neobacillus bataviensis TaxID=220685 RepID=UPI001CBB5B0F|nr:GIY-YIG nuclease family protein [Neobacillus bataviensis]
MGEQFLKAGIYAIINKSLNMVYIGETEENFIVRWVEHIMRIPSFFENEDRTMLYLHKDTKFIVLKELEPPIHNRKNFYHYEFEASKFYKERGWMILSHHTQVQNMEDKPKEGDRGPNLDRYRKTIKQMIKVLGLINTKNNNIPMLYNGLYKKINKHFETEVSKREGKNVLGTLSKDELLFIMMDLYPRYSAKHLEVHRVEYNKQDRQLSLFK